MKPEFIKFIATSGIAAFINVIARLGFSLFVSYEIAIVCAYVIGMISAYILARKFVFEPSGHKVQREFSGFIVVNIIALIQVWTVSVIFNKWGLPMIGWTFERELIAHLIGVVSPTFTSYFGHKHISFRKK